LLVGPIFSQTTVSLDEVNNHIGDSITVCGKVYSTRYLVSAKGSPTFLNLGAAYPNQKLTVVIWSKVRNQFESLPEEMFDQKDVCVTGKIETYKGKPQIVINLSDQIIIKK
jgi:micrococcal nuclease